MWSFIGSKNQQRWLWHALDHATGQVLAYVLSDRKDAAFLKLNKRPRSKLRGIGPVEIKAVWHCPVLHRGLGRI